VFTGRLRNERYETRFSAVTSMLRIIRDRYVTLFRTFRWLWRLTVVLPNVIHTSLYVFTWF